MKKITFSRDARAGRYVLMGYVKVGVTYRITRRDSESQIANGPLKELRDEYLVIAGPNGTEQRIDYADIGEIEHQ